jgi:hypothetical protein
VSLGRESGYIQLVRADDTPRPIHLSGRTAAKVKEMICTMVVKSPMKERQKPGVYSWPSGPKHGPKSGAAA